MAQIEVGKLPGLACTQPFFDVDKDTPADAAVLFCGMCHDRIKGMGAQYILERAIGNLRVDQFNNISKQQYCSTASRILETASPVRLAAEETIAEVTQFLDALSPEQLQEVEQYLESIGSGAEEAAMKVICVLMCFMFVMTLTMASAPITWVQGLGFISRVCRINAGLVGSASSARGGSSTSYHLFVFCCNPVYIYYTV